MSSEGARRLSGGESIEIAWRRIRDCLESRRAQILDEIREYPKPIPGCDLQFNTLLEERSRVSQELSDLHELTERDCDIGEALAAIKSFITSSAFIIGEVEREIRASVDPAGKLIGQ